MRKKEIMLVIAIMMISGGCVAGVYSDQKSGEEESPITAIFNKRCSGCHGFDGRPVKANLPNIPDFTNPEFHRKRTDAQLVESITDGKPPIMPDYGTKLDKEQIKSLVSYIRAFSKKKR